MDQETTPIASNDHLHTRKDGQPDRRYKLGSFIDETGRRFDSLGAAATFFQTRKSTIHLVLTRRLQSWRGHVFTLCTQRQAAPEPVDGVDLICAVAAKACGRRMSIKDLSRLLRTNAALRHALRLAAEDLVS